MSRYIDADALPRHGQRGGLVHWKDIEEAPSIDIEPKRGEWIESDFEEIKCSVCGSAWDYCDNDCERFNFCPNCGADMREVRDE